MTNLERADWTLVEDLLERAGTRVPDYADEVIARAVQGRQRPAWMLPGWWDRADGAFTAGVRWAVLLALLALASLGALLVWAASQPTHPPLLTGNGLIAVTVDAPPGPGGYEVRLVDPATTSVAPGTPTWPGAAFGFSPDGSRLLYLVVTDEHGSQRAAGGSLWTAGVDGTLPVRLTGELGEVTAASWSPDGRRVVVAFLEDGLRTRIGVVDADGSGMRVLDLGGPADTPSWDPSGRRILFRGLRETHRALYTVAADDPADIRGVVGLDDAASDSGIEPQAAWSPDGRWVAYVRLIPGAGFRTALHVVAVDGSDDRVLPVTSHVSVQMRPQWSPDGRRIVARVLPRVVVVDVEREVAWPIGPEVVDSSWALRDLRWSPDGRWVVAGPHYTAQAAGDAIGWVEPRVVVVDAVTGAWKDAPPGADMPMFGPAQTIAWQPTER